MRLLGMAILMAGAAGLGLGMARADDAYIRLEAWREPAEAAAKAQGWAARFPETVTWQAGSWIAIGLGPIEGDAKARMAGLKADRSIPRDAYLVTLGDDTAVSPVTAGAAPEAASTPSEATPSEATPSEATEADATDDATAEAVDDSQTAAETDAATPAAGLDSTEAAETDATDDATTEAVDDSQTAAGTDATTPAAGLDSTEAAEADTTAEAPAPLTYIRLEAFQSRDEADAALTRWRSVLPGASLWQLPNGWHTVAIGPLPAEAAAGWLSAWKAADAIPADAFAATDAELGTLLAEGGPLDLDAAPPVPPRMPPTEVVQEVLHWAGRYDGEIDGRPGPQTNAAIAAEMEAQGIPPGTRNGEAIAMQALLARREAWQSDMGLAPLTDTRTGLALTVPLDRLEFLREDRGLSIYGPRDDSGAALILFNQPGGRAEMEDLAGLITALGWVGHPVREVTASRFTLDGSNQTHIGHAEGRLVDGHLRGFVLIWPAADAENAPRLAAVAAETLAPAPVTDAPAESAD